MELNSASSSVKAIKRRIICGKDIKYLIAANEINVLPQ